MTGGQGMLEECDASAKRGRGQACTDTGLVTLIFHLRVTRQPFCVGFRVYLARQSFLLGLGLMSLERRRDLGLVLEVHEACLTS